MMQPHYKRGQGGYMPIEKRCIYCNRWYTAQRKNSLFCSDKCRQAAHRDGIAVRRTAPKGVEVNAALAQLREDANAFRALAVNTAPRYRRTCCGIADALDEILGAVKL